MLRAVNVGIIPKLSSPTYCVYFVINLQLLISSGVLIYVYNSRKIIYFKNIYNMVAALEITRHNPGFYLVRLVLLEDWGHDETCINHRGNHTHRVFS